MTRCAVLLFVLLGLLVGWSRPAPAQDDIVVRIVATNPSEVEARDVEVRHPLPQGVGEQHVIDAGGLEIGFDEANGVCFVHGVRKLEPKASATFRVEIRNVWRIERERIEAFRKHSEQLNRKLAQSPHAPLAQRILGDVDGDLQQLMESVESDPGPTVPVEEYIRLQRGVRETMESLRQKVGALEALVVREGKDPGELFGSAVDENNPYAETLQAVQRRAPVETDWKLVIGVLAVLAVVSVGSFLVWSRQAHRLRATETRLAAQDEEAQS